MSFDRFLDSSIDYITLHGARLRVTTVRFWPETVFGDEDRDRGIRTVKFALLL